ncbi:helix-turn-helix domain-containing protein [Halococcus sediminicola]|uniref:helix-turn-helix domain-containing protein n=1 Tax=Halococcus sediminicola TaxID=1264579 RepID=UPI0006797646|nr:helix-turn-helix domain-containing protein [Halococcus sediminicola]
MTQTDTRNNENERAQFETSLVAEFVIDRPSYVAILDELPNTQLIVEGMTACDSETVLITFWANGPDLATLERGLENEPSIQTIEVLSGTDADQKLYQVRLSGAATTYWGWINLGGVLLGCTLDYEGKWIRMRFPNRDALVACRDYCADHGYSFALNSLQPTSSGVDSKPTGLTVAQDELLTAATNEGYFNVPRNTTMDNLADSFNISNQAASERLRRGISNILANRPPRSAERLLSQRPNE